MLILERIATGSLVPLEAEFICPDYTRELSISEIERLAVFHGNRSEPLAEHFKVAGTPSESIRLLGDCSTVKWVGTTMSAGEIVVEGNIGMHLGSEMAGGKIEVRGNSGDWVGAEMKGGRIHVRGNAGHLIGAAYRGGKVGMRGGEILIEGNVGNEVGGQMRRGLIAIGGSCNDFAGVAMIAGTVLVFGSIGIRPGAGMKRGTIAILDSSEQKTELLPTFRYACDYRPDFLSLYQSRLRSCDFAPAKSFSTPKHFARYSGDLLELGKGEILVASN